MMPHDDQQNAPEHPETGAQPSPDAGVEGQDTPQAGTPDGAGSRETPTEAAPETGTPTGDQVERDQQAGRGGFSDPPAE